MAPSRWCLGAAAVFLAAALARAGDDGGAVAKVVAPAPAPSSAGAAAAIWWVMLSRDHECSTEDVDIDDADTVEECAMRCAVF
jgi:hypothetical protein